MNPDLLSERAVSPFMESVAFEYLYENEYTSLKKITEATVQAEKLPSEVFAKTYGMFEPENYSDIAQFIKKKLENTHIAINHTPSWPKKLLKSERPTPIIYYQGDIGLLEAKSISLVGARKASPAGLSCAAALAGDLTADGFTIVSGLAKGIDTAAMTSAINHGGSVIGVIGTPLDTAYPRENSKLQEQIAKEHLLVSQVPIYRYYHQDFKSKKYYFPERNELMAAISDATVIVEASNTSGSLIQARACLHQGHPLFIMRTCSQNPNLTWPQRFLEKEGVYEAKDAKEITALLAHLKQKSDHAQ